MNGWIPTTAPYARSASNKKGKVKEDVASSQSQFPTLEAGSLSPVALCQTSDRLDWTYLIRDDDGSSFFIHKTALLTPDRSKSRLLSP
jgi:hypothetical protein